MSTTLKLVTFNIRCCYNTFDGVNGFVHRAGLVFDKIDAEKPDVICFQEVIPPQVSLLRRSLRDYTFIYNGRLEGFDGEGLCIAVHRDTEILSHDFFWLSPTPKVPASRFEADQSPCPRIATASMLRKDGSAFLVYNAHLDHIGEAARVKGASVLLDRISSDVTAYPLPVFVMGDFNATPDSRCIETFRSFKNPSLTDLTSGIPTTFHDFGKRTDDFKIDYIFSDDASSSGVKDCHLWDECCNGMYLSDHYPISVTVTV